MIDWGFRILLNIPKAIESAMLGEGMMVGSETAWLSLAALAS